MRSKKKTVIFGGSFDPIHVGHLSLASEVCRRGLANEVWFMVSPQNPHKQGCVMTDESLRLQMVRLAIEGCPGFHASDFEFGLPRPSYTVNTLAALEQAFPDREFLLLIGADNWEKFGCWYKGDEILERYGIIVYPRDSEDVPELPEGVTWMSAELHDVSSTMLRGMVAGGKDIAGLVPGAVAEFIEKNELYK
jgi:nicotinate-nucleotide adenylyltransferase